MIAVIGAVLFFAGIGLILFGVGILNDTTYHAHQMRYDLTGVVVLLVGAALLGAGMGLLGAGT